jgi:hypothetical protein
VVEIASPEHVAAAAISGHEFVLQACARTFAIRCRDDESARIVAAGFSGLSIAATARAVTGAVTVATSACRGFTVSNSGGREMALADADQLMFCADKWLTLALQRSRPDLYFLHAAVVASRGRIAVIAAPSGVGKSTLAFALLERGFEYLSDELAPIEPQTGRVWPYPRAMCLKSAPPEPYRLPPAAVRCGQRIYVPVKVRRNQVADPLCIASLFFLRREPEAKLVCRSLGAAAAAAHVVSTTLNSLAHPRGGLDIATSLVSRVPCYELNGADLNEACVAVEARLNLDANLRSAGPFTSPS